MAKDFANNIKFEDGYRYSDYKSGDKICSWYWKSSSRHIKSQSPSQGWGIDKILSFALKFCGFY